VLIRPSSKVIVKFLQVMMKHGASLATCLPYAGAEGWFARLWFRAGRSTVPRPSFHCRCRHGLTSCRMPTGYIGEFEIVDDHRAGKVVVSLLGESLPPLVVSLGLVWAPVVAAGWSSSVGLVDR
jgi:hypothetical protein